eukprot:Nk52_evm72s1737 gene=Nk52_evmTU72s1737
MEKFGKFRDPGTGIQPFLPPKAPITPHGVPYMIFDFLKQRVVGPLLAIVRCVLLLAVFLLYFVLNLVTYCIPVAILRRPVDRFVTAICCRLALFFLGFWWINSDTVTLAKNIREKNSPESKISNNGKLRSGDIIICNHTSYVDILYLGFRYTPVFVYTPNKWDENSAEFASSEAADANKEGDNGSVVVGVKLLSLLQALKHTVQCPEYSLNSDGNNKKGNGDMTVKEVVEKSRKSCAGPVVLFPEGSSSNGRSLLHPTLFECGLLSGVDLTSCYIQIVGMKYPFTHFSPSYTVGSVWMHLFRLCCQMTNYLDVKFLCSRDHPKPTSNAPGAHHGLWAGETFQTLGNVLRLRRSRMSALTKQNFLKYWDQVFGSGKGQKRPRTY